MSVKKFVEIGGKKEYFKAYKVMVLGAMEIVKEKPIKTEK